MWHLQIDVMFNTYINRIVVNWNNWNVNVNISLNIGNIVPCEQRPFVSIFLDKSGRGRSKGLCSQGSNVAARKVFPHWSQKTITHHCLSVFPIASRLLYRAIWLLGLGELLHDWILIYWFGNYTVLFSTCVFSNSKSSSSWIEYSTRKQKK